MNINHNENTKKIYVHNEMNKVVTRKNGKSKRNEKERKKGRIVRSFTSIIMNKTQRAEEKVVFKVFILNFTL